MKYAEWLVQIFANDTDGDECIGTGYSIGEGLVITARHVVLADNRAEDPKLKLVWVGQDNHEELFADKDIVYDGGEDNDIAVIRCPQPLPFQPPTVGLYHSNPGANLPWSCRGYLRAGKEGSTRTDKSVSGKITGYKDFSIGLRVGDELAKEEYWGGLSGAPVFIDDTKLIAIITGRHIKIKQRLESVSIPAMLEDPEFCKAIGYTATKKIPKDKGKFKKLLIQKISRALKHSDASSLYDALIKELDIDIDDKSKNKLLTEIVNELLALDTNTAIRDVLTGAAFNCVNVEGYYYEESQDKIPRIKQIAEDVLGWLVLSCIDEKQIVKLIPEGFDADSLYFILGHNTFAGVELAMSRRFQHKADWLGKDTISQHGRNCIPTYTSSFANDDDEVVRTLLIDIWNKVFNSPEEQKEEQTKLTTNEIKLLNSTISIRRKKKRNTEHYYFAFEIDAIEPNRVKAIFAKLLGKDMLNEMTVVEMGSESGSKVLLIDEYDIIAAINEFYREINRDKNKQVSP